ncbi:hypothetical protein BMJ44_14835, partial [Listeria monocytogenes]|nr:hypothetical protein [Listeria monocytogenes]
NSEIDNEEMKYILVKSSATVLIVSDKLWEKFKIDLNDTLVKIVFVFNNNSMQFTTINLNQSSYDKVNQLDFPNIRKDGGFIIFSSGTTGKPKGILHSQKNMYYSYQEYSKKHLKITEEDVFYSTSRLTYTFGFANSTYYSFGGGASVILSEKNDVWTIAENINKYRPTVLATVPSTMQMLFKARKLLKLDLSSVRVIITAGEKFSNGFYEEWRSEFDTKIIDVFGSSEILSAIISTSLGSHMEGGEKVGENVAKLINTETNKEIIGEGTGVLEIEGNSVSNEYIGEKPNREKKFRTNDIFYRSKNDLYQYVGRSNNITKVNGMFVNVEIIERELEDIDLISDSLVIKEEEHSKLMAYIVTENLVFFTEEKAIEVMKVLKSKLAHFLCPHIIILVNSVPRNLNGKKIRKLIPEQEFLKTFKL